MPWYKLLLDSQFWMEIFEHFSVFAPLVGILLVMVEAFIPILPLSVFVAINVMAFGFWQGYLYSWIGNVTGSIIVFKTIKRFGTARFQKIIQKSKRIKNIFIWIENHGFFPIFVLLTFPFTPSFVVCGLSALAGVKNKTFYYSIIYGKLFMILSLSFIGFNLSEFIKQPIKSSLFIAITLSISLIGKFVIGRYEKKLDLIRQRMEADGKKIIIAKENIYRKVKSVRLRRKL